MNQPQARIQPQIHYSTKHISPTLLREIKQALREVRDFGSIEIYIQNHSVTQITVRQIKKTNGFPTKISQTAS